MVIRICCDVHHLFSQKLAPDHERDACSNPRALLLGLPFTKQLIEIEGSDWTITLVWPLTPLKTAHWGQLILNCKTHLRVGEYNIFILQPLSCVLTFMLRWKFRNYLLKIGISWNSAQKSLWVSWCGIFENLGVQMTTRVKQWLMVLAFPPFHISIL